MTGEKNRGTTQEKLWNLDDKTLATPAHDELVLKLLNKEYVLKLFNDLFEDKNNVIYFYSHSEVPITTSSGFLSGYWDVVITYCDKHCPIHSDKILINDVNRGGGLYCDLCNNTYSAPDYLYKYLYIEVKPKIESFGAVLRQLNTYRHLLEQKNKPRRVTLKNIYDNVTGLTTLPIVCYSSIIIFTPDLRFKDAFESQGIKVISPLKEE